MTNISQINTDTKWDAAVSTLNTNFVNLNTAIIKAKNQTMIKLPLCESESDLKEKYPPAYEGQMGLVGTTLPAILYKVEKGQWTSTGTSVGNPSAILTDCVGYDSKGTTDEVNI